MANEVIRTYTAGDTLPNLSRKVPTSTGITDMSGGTIRLRIDRPNGVPLTKTITDALGADGHIDAPAASPPTFFIIWLATDLIAGDGQRAEIEYENAAGSIATERDLFFNVGEALG
jgi:hypothetical protein